MKNLIQEMHAVLKSIALKTEAKKPKRPKGYQKPAAVWWDSLTVEKREAALWAILKDKMGRITNDQMRPSIQHRASMLYAKLGEGWVEHADFAFADGVKLGLMSASEYEDFWKAK